MWTARENTDTVKALPYGSISVTNISVQTYCNKTCQMEMPTVTDTGVMKVIYYTVMNVAMVNRLRTA